MNLNELKAIISRGEDSFHQFKEDIRNHDSLAAEMVAFSKEELRRLFQEVDLLHADEIPTRAGIEAINVNRFAKFFEDVYHEILPISNEERLKLFENMNLACNNRLNLAGLLLFADKPQFYKPVFILKAVSFAGVSIADSYLDSEDFEGSLPVIFQGALAFIMRHLRKVQNQKGVNTIGDPEVPRIVFEELLVNSLIHRDYFISAPIRLFIFDDRVEIISPGNLPDHLPLKKYVQEILINVIPL